VSWWEVLGPEPKVLRDFYTELFGWRGDNTDQSGDFEYYEFEAGDRGIPGGIGSSPDGRAHVNIYAAVEDLQSRLDRAEALGGKTAMPPTKAGDDTEIALLVDPQGNTFGPYVRHP
jgi:predicted enzyme related to lactoylglutathione lyase